MSIEAIGVVSAGFKGGFFSGRSSTGDGKLFGKTVVGFSSSLFDSMNLVEISFLRELLDGRFHGEVKLAAVGTQYVHDIQYSCNVTVEEMDWRYQISRTLPAFRISFSGFTFSLNGDLNLGIRFNFWPSHCESDGSMGARFQPYVFFDLDGYSELENDVTLPLYSLLYSLFYFQNCSTLELEPWQL